jgi:hypothetical protein
MTRAAILAAIQIVGAILSAFGGALIKAEPPGVDVANAASYIGSFASVVVLLIITAVAKHFKKITTSIVWLALTLIAFLGFVGVALVYEQNRRALTVGEPPAPAVATKWRVIGTKKTPFGEQVFAKAQAEGKTDVAVVLSGVKSGDPISLVWTEASIQDSVKKLTAEYVMVIVLLSIAIFCGVEAAFSTAPARRHRRSRREVIASSQSSNFNARKDSVSHLGEEMVSSLAFRFDNSNPINLFIKEDLIEANLVDVVENAAVDWADDKGAISVKDLIAVNAVLFLNKTSISGARPNDVEDKRAYAQRFWRQVVTIADFGEDRAKCKTVAAQPVVLKALAKLAYAFAYGRNADRQAFDKLMEGMAKIDYSHDNKMWRYYLLSNEERELLFPRLKLFLPPEQTGRIRDIGAYDQKECLMRFGAKHSDIYPILGDMIRWSLELPNRHKSGE